jgi:hypothetical protein
VPGCARSLTAIVHARSRCPPACARRRERRCRLSNQALQQSNFQANQATPCPYRSPGAMSRLVNCRPCPSGLAPLLTAAHTEARRRVGTGYLITVPLRASLQVHRDTAIAPERRTQRAAVVCVLPDRRRMALLGHDATRPGPETKAATANSQQIPPRSTSMTRAADPQPAAGCGLPTMTIPPSFIRFRVADIMERQPPDPHPNTASEPRRSVTHRQNCTLFLIEPYGSTPTLRDHVYLWRWVSHSAAA